MASVDSDDLGQELEPGETAGELGESLEPSKTALGVPRDTLVVYSPGEIILEREDGFYKSKNLPEQVFSQASDFENLVVIQPNPVGGPILHPELDKIGSWERVGRVKYSRGYEEGQIEDIDNLEDVNVVRPEDLEESELPYTVRRDDLTDEYYANFL